MKKKILIVIADYYKDISNGLLRSAKNSLQNFALKIKVPGVSKSVTISKNIKKYHAFIALGCVIKGQTPHFDFISQASTNAIMNISIKSKKPIGNGIITCLNMKQAKARKKKGIEAVKAITSVLLQKMRTSFSPKNNPRVIIIQKLYGKFFNDEELNFPKHRFKKFIKDVVSGTIERNDILIEELDKNFEKEFNFNNLDKLFQVILKSATYELLYKPNVSINIIIKEYLNASNFFLDNSQTKYLNALLYCQKIRINNAWFELINKYFSKLSLNNKDALNLNDDVFDKSKKLVISIDTYVEGIHFIDFKNLIL